MNNQANPNQAYPPQQVAHPYPPMMPPGQQSYPYGQTGQNPFYPYGEPAKEGKGIGWIILLILGVVLTGGLAWWWIKNKKGTSSTKVTKGLYEVQQETIQRLNVTVAEQEAEIDRLNQLLKAPKQLVELNHTLSSKSGVQLDKSEEKAEEAKLPIDPHVAFRDSFGLDLSQSGNKKLLKKFNELIDWLIQTHGFFHVQELQDTYKNDAGYKAIFTATGIQLVFNENKVSISAEEILNGEFYEKYQAFVEEKAQ